MPMSGSDSNTCQKAAQFGLSRMAHLITLMIVILVGMEVKI